MERESLLMYRGTWGMLQDIRANNMDEYIEAVDMFFNYAFDGVEPDMDGASLVLRLFWKAAKPLIDANNRNYVNGCKGGAPSESMKGNQNARKNKQTENKPKTNPKQTTGKTENKPKQTQNKGNDNDNVNDNVKDNVHGNVNANEHDNDNENVNIKEKEINKEKNPYVDISIDGEPFITDLKKYNEWIAEHGDPEEEEGA